jgi:hypothetical protein
MQNGSMIRAGRRRGPDVWEFRWREPGADGKRKHRRIVLAKLGSIEQLADEAAARQAISALRLEFNRVTNARQMRDEQLGTAFFLIIVRIVSLRYIA